MKVLLLAFILKLGFVWNLNINEGDRLLKGYVHSTIPSLHPAWYVSFEVKLLGTITGWSDIIHFTTGRNKANQGSRIPAVFIVSDSSTLHICSGLNGKKNKCQESESLPFGQFTKVEISQKQTQNLNVYEYTIKVGGREVYKTDNNQSRYFSNVKVYRSDRWYDSANARIKNLVYGNLPHVYKPALSTIIQTIPFYHTEYKVSFEVKPLTKVENLGSIIHVTKSGNVEEIGDRIPAVWFQPNTFKLQICSTVNNITNHCVKGQKDLPVNRFTLVEISQTFQNGVYIYKVAVNGSEIHSIQNNNPITIQNVKVYSADPWYEAAKAEVRNIDVQTSDKAGYAPKRGQALPEIPIIQTQWYLSFDIKPLASISEWASIIHFTLGADKTAYGDRVPGIWFRPSTTQLWIAAPINGNKSYHYEGSPPLALNQFINVRIRQNLDVTTGAYTFVISLGDNDVHTVVNEQPRTFENVKSYIGDPWYAPANALVRNVVFQNLPNGYTYAGCHHARESRGINCSSHTGITSFRSVDGTCNNLQHPAWGSANTALVRIVDPAYADDGKFDTPRGFPGTNPTLPAPNAVSQKLFGVESTNTGSRQKITTLFMTFGQFLDHDVTETPHQSCKQTCTAEAAWQYPCFPLLFDDKTPECSPNGRSTAGCSNRAYLEPRQQQNDLTAFVDGSQIYGTYDSLFQALRNKTDGKMKIRVGGLLPIAADQGIGGCFTKGGCSLVGDVRGDENIALHCMHTLWIREHNRIATELKSMNPAWNDEKLFQTARKITSSLWQHITYEEYVPILTKVGPYTGYKDNVNPSISNTFASAAFRYGHSLVPNEFAQLNNNFDKENEPVTLQEAFFNRAVINDRGIEQTMRGLVGNMSNNVDEKFSFAIARKLFIGLGQEGYLDLTALNIQRGRDHGLSGYNVYRKHCGLPIAKTWDDIKNFMLSDAAAKFEEIYESPDDIDIFAGGISEKHVTNLEVGPIFNCVLGQQFKDLRDGDRFFYKNPGVFTTAQLDAIKLVKLSTILCNNLKGLISIQPDAFQIPEGTRNRRRVCTGDDIPKLDLEPWREATKDEIEVKTLKDSSIYNMYKVVDDPIEEGEEEEKTTKTKVAKKEDKGSLKFSHNLAEDVDSDRATKKEILKRLETIVYTIESKAKDYVKRNNHPKFSAHVNNDNKIDKKISNKKRDDFKEDEEEMDEEVIVGEKKVNGDSIADELEDLENAINKNLA